MVFTLIVSYLHFVGYRFNCVTGSDPYFAIRLLGGSLLCYSFQGLHNTIFNLLGNDHLQITALFVPDDTNWDNTWLGSITIAVLQKTITLQFIAADHSTGIPSKKLNRSIGTVTQCI